MFTFMSFPSNMRGFHPLFLKSLCPFLLSATLHQCICFLLGKCPTCTLCSAHFSSIFFLFFRLIDLTSSSQSLYSAHSNLPLSLDSELFRVLFNSPIRLFLITTSADLLLPLTSVYFSRFFVYLLISVTETWTCEFATVMPVEIQFSLLSSSYCCYYYYYWITVGYL